MVFIITCIKPKNFNTNIPHDSTSSCGVFSTHSMATNYIMDLVEKHHLQQDGDSNEELEELLLDELIHSGGIFIGDEYFKIEECKIINDPINLDDDDEDD